jgi:hypothetical protein
VQVELEALPPEVLRGLCEQEIGRYWDAAAYDAVLAREAEERESL